jgi:hypothetical protein
MSKEFPTRDEDGELIKKSFSSIKFSCIRCGLQYIEINEIQPYPSKGREAALSSLHFYSVEDVTIGFT